jgi:signal transduction histidine kinase
MGAPEQPLHAAVTRTAERLTARSNATLKLDLDTAVELPRNSRNEVLRILSEALANGLRHGRASAFAVRLRRDGVTLLEIADNGVGFDPAANENGGAGVGLASMKERARSFGGELRVRSQRGGGTVVEVVLP